MFFLFIFFTEEKDIINVISCKFEHSNVHILRDPRSLPCGFTICKLCIDKLINELKEPTFCTLCSGSHEISSLKKSSLIVNHVAVRALKIFGEHATINSNRKLNDILKKLESIEKLFMHVFFLF